MSNNISFAKRRSSILNAIALAFSQAFSLEAACIQVCTNYAW